MKVSSSYRDIWNIAYPITLGMLAEKAIDLVDTAFMARVGEAELGATGLGGVFYFFTVILGFAIAMGAQIIIARKEGQGDHGGIGKILDNTVMLTFALAAFVFLFIYFVSPMIFELILKSDDVRAANNDYLQYRAFGLFFTMGAFSFRSFYVGIAKTPIITYSAILMAVINIPLDYLFVFGMGTIPAMGIKGAAIASVIAEFSALLLLWVVAARKQSFAKYKLFESFRIDKDAMRSIVKLSAPIMFQFIFAMTAWYTFFLIIEKMGELELAVSNVVRSAYMILMTPVFGFSFAANSMVSNLIGQGKESEVMLLVKKISIISVITTFLILLLAVPLAEPILKILASEQYLVDASLGSYYIVCFTMIIFAFTMISFHAVSGTGATREGMIIEIISITAYLSYIYYFAIVEPSTVEVVWASEVIYWTMIGILSTFYLRSLVWKKYIDLK